MVLSQGIGEEKSICENFRREEPNGKAESLDFLSKNKAGKFDNYFE